MSALPVVVTTGEVPIEGRAAVPVYVDAGVPQGGGPARNVIVVTGGPMAGGPAIPVYAAPAGVSGIGPALPVYVVSGSLGATGPSTLLTSIISYWKLEEASGTRVDAVTASGNDLTDNNTVTQNTGIIANCGQFTRATTEFLSRADNASLSTGDIDYTVAAWVYLDSKPAGAMGIMSKDGGGANREYLLQWNNVNDRFEMRLFDTAGASIGIAVSNTFGAPTTATWYLVIGYHDSVNNLVGISVNAGTADTTATTGVPADENATFYIGADQGVVTWDGRIDEVGFWKKVLSATERSTLYNGGTGRTYPFTGAP